MTDEKPRYWIFDTTLCVATVVHPNPSRRSEAIWGPNGKSPDWETYNRLKLVLAAAGFTFEKEERIKAQHPVLLQFHDLARRMTPHGELFVACETYPAGCRFEFFQEIVTENQNGGRYDFDRRSKMPYLIRKTFEGVTARMRGHLDARGFTPKLKAESPCLAFTVSRKLAIAEGRGPAPSAAEISQAAQAYFNGIWDGEYERRRGTHRFQRNEDGWPTDREIGYWSREDADGVIIEHGALRYYRDHKGYVRRGLCFGGINGQWILVHGTSRADFTHRSAHELFSKNPSTAGRKIHPRPRKLEDVLAAEIKAQRFERCAQLRDIIAAHQTKAAA